jgi:type II secretory pathway predicted ATPase ExeA
MIAPDDEFLYLSRQHSKALAYMDYAVWQSGGFVVITGDVGSGKTILMKRLMRRFNKKAVCLNLSFTNLDSKELFQYLALQAEINVNTESKVGIIIALKKYFQEMSDNGKPCVLVVDEAQNLTLENLEDIRMLVGLETNNKPLLSVVMLGQPEFMDKVNESEQLKQRIKLNFNLTGLTEVEVSKYVDYRLSVGGVVNKVIFSPEVIKEIYKYTKGIPRLINKLCDALLMCAYVENRKVALQSDVDEVLDDLMLRGNVKSEGAELPPEIKGESKVVNLINKAPGSIKIQQQLFERAVVALENINMNLESIVKNSEIKKEVG